jgi:carbon monoxide dehydrogenase subunit G
MAHYRTTVSSPHPPDEVFRYLADFRSAAEWDPSIIDVTLVGEGEAIAVGARFRVTTKTRFSEIILQYTTTAIDPPGQITLRGENNSMVSVDTITIAPDGPVGSTVTYDAEITLSGARRLADPLLQLAFQRLGDKARDGLRSRLATDRL